MTEKAKRIENALTRLGLQQTTIFTVSELEKIAKLADVRMFEVMAYVRYR